jgi:hypothetical protein
MMHSAIRRIVTVCAVAWLAGCATAPREDATFVAPRLSFRTPAPAELGYPVRVAQLITARYGDETYVFEAELSVSPESLTLVCIDSFGRRAMTIVSQGGRITTDAASWVPSALRAQNILADIALIYWPDAAVRRGFDGTAAAVKIEGQRRTITIEGQDIISVNYGAAENGHWPSMARYSNKGFGYELVLRSSVMSP